MVRRLVTALILLAVVIFALLAAYAAHLKAQRRALAENVWGGPDLSASEEAFVKTRLDRVLDAWNAANRSTREEFDENRNLYLCIDTDKGAIWIEEDGEVFEGHEFALPPKLQWSIWHVEPGGTTQLESPVHLKVRGPDRGMHFPEAITLAGEISPKGYILTRCGTGARPWRRTSSAFVPAVAGQDISFLPVEEGRVFYESMLVNHEEYESALARSELESADTDAAPPPSSQPRDPADEWSKIEPQIYRAIEADGVLRNLDLTRIEVVAGPTGVGGHAEAEFARPSFVDRFTRGAPRRCSGFYLFRHIGEGIWYVTGGVGNITHDGQTELEFLRSGSGEPPADQNAWLERGRRLPDDSPPPAVEWTVPLDVGADFEVLGVSEYPSGARWWGPDGTELDYTPYVLGEIPPESRPSGRAFQVAFRFKKHHEAVVLRMSWEGWFNEIPGGPRDVYGRELADIQGYWFLWERPEESVDMTLSFGDANAASTVEHVDCENISLVPGKDAGFRMVLRSEPGRE